MSEKISLLTFINKKNNPLSAMFELFANNIKILASGEWYKKKIISNQIYKQILFTGIDALPLILFSAMMVGFIVIAQSLVYLPQFGGNEYIGKVLAFVIREIGPIIIMFIIIGRSGNAVSVEMANMKLNGEIYYLENILKIDGFLFLMFPRFIGFIISIVCLSVFFNVFTILTGYFSALLFIYAPLGVFLEKLLQSITFIDIAVWIIKIFCFGIIISLVSFYQGINIEMTVREVPRVTTRCFIQAMTYCLVIDVIITAIVIFI